MTVAQNWVRETTSTPGTGDITPTGAVDSKHITFAIAIPDKATFIYAVENGNNRELGIGTYNSGANTVERTTILQTLVAGTFNNTNPTAINLSGDSEIYITVHAGMLIPRQTAINAGEKFYTMEDAAIGTTHTFAADVIYFSPWHLTECRRPSHIGIEVTTQQPGSVARIGIFIIENVRDAILIHDLGTVDTSTVGDKDIALSTEKLPPGNYAVGVVSDAAIVTRANLYEHLKLQNLGSLFGSNFGTLQKTHAGAAGSGFSASYTNCDGKYNVNTCKSYFKQG